MLLHELKKVHALNRDSVGHLQKKLKLYKMVQNGHFFPIKNRKLPIKMMGMMGPR